MHRFFSSTRIVVEPTGSIAAGVELAGSIAAGVEPAGSIATGNAHNCAFGKQSSVDVEGRESLACGFGLEIISPFSPITSKRSARVFMSSSSNSIFSSPNWHSLGGRLVVIQPKFYRSLRIISCSS